MHARSRSRDSSSSSNTVEQGRKEASPSENVVLDDSVFDWNDETTKNADSPKETILPFVNAFFLTVATVLGTGILGLPVKLAKPGFSPFLLSYFVTFIMQALTLVFTVEVMQRGRIVTETEDAAQHKIVPLEDFDVTNSDDEADLNTLAPREAETTNGLERYTNNNQTQDHGADLHTLGKMFLANKFFEIPFDACVILHFISILISYSLAGSLAYAQLFGIEAKFQWLIVPFGLIFATLLIAGQELFPVIFQSGLSLATFGKGGLLILMVAVTAMVAAEVNLPIADDWRYVGRPFLIGTVAMGGAVNILPVVFGKVKFRRRDMIIFTCVVIGGLFFVWILNIFWCYFLLKTIPQVEDPNESEDNVLTLRGAETFGKPSTVPLVNIIYERHPSFAWIATTVDLFIMTSITVSFITVGAGLKHVLDGIAREWKSAPIARLSPTEQPAISALKDRLYSLDMKWKKAVLYAISFGFVLGVAITNPRSFIFVMEKVTSLALNLEAGAFVVVMLQNSRTTANTPIPMKVPHWIYNLRYPVVVYFLFAVVYDGVSLVLEMIGIDFL